MEWPWVSVFQGIFMHKCSTKIPAERIFEILSKNYFFVQMEHDELFSLLEMLWQYELEPGEVLLQEGQTDGNLYLIIGGRVRLTKEIGEEVVTINELGPGEMVGVHGLLANVKCTATVTAIRKTKVLVITREIFNSHIASHPSSMLEIASIGIKQALGNKDTLFHPKSAYSIALIPAGDYQGMPYFVKCMKASMSVNDDCLLIDEAFILSNPLFNILEINDNTINEIIYQLELLEEKYAYLIYIASSEFNDWTSICIRMSNRIVAVAEETNNNLLNQTESAIFSEWTKNSLEKQLVLIHSPDKKFATHSAAWTKNRGLDRVFNIRADDKNDVARLLRDITNRSVAMVLCGAGARGFAHLGVMRAIEELGIKIDYVGGSSIGAIFAAFMAMELSAAEVYERWTKNFSTIIDYTLPAKALASGGKLDQLLQAMIGEEIAMEHVWRPLFCVATDLSNGQLVMLNQGCLWRSVRASASLPGIFPPLADADGRILVDGAILNNLPVDIMSSYLRDNVHGKGRIIAVNIETMDNFKFRGIDHPRNTSWLGKLKGKMGWKARDNEIDLPNIFHTISKSMMIASEQHFKDMLKRATYTVTINPRDYDLLDFKNVTKVMDIGYTSALEQLRKIAKKL